MPAHAKVSYVDRMKTDELRREYPELADWDLTEVDIVDDGEKLATIAAERQDFIVANHFLEHCENPIGTIETHLGKLKPGGVLFYAVPDKRYTFDFRRAGDAARAHGRRLRGGARALASRALRRVGPPGDRRGSGGRAATGRLGGVGRAKARELEDAEYSIHMHVWTQAEFLQLILACRERFGDAFDIEAAARRAIEFIVVLRKRGPCRPSATAAAPAAAASPPRWSGCEVRTSRRRALAKARSEVRRRRARP